MENEMKNKRSVGKTIFKLIYNLIITAIVLVALFEAIIGFINMQKINNEEEPVWYIDKSIEEKDNIKETKYNLGLYRIVKKEEEGKMNIVLKPFFIK